MICQKIADYKGSSISEFPPIEICTISFVLQIFQLSVTYRTFVAKCYHILGYFALNDVHICPILRAFNFQNYLGFQTHL